MSKEPRIFYSIPTDTGTVEGAFLPIYAQWSAEYNLHLNLEIHHQPLDSARNAAIHRFLANQEFTHFVGMDNDIIPSVDVLAQLLGANKPVISPLVFATKTDPQGNPCPIPLVLELHGEKPMFKLTVQGIEEVDIFPGGMYMIKREVFNRVKPPLFGYLYDKYGQKTKGSDVYASNKFTKAGVKMYVHTEAFCDQMVKIGVMAFNNTMVKYGSGKKPERSDRLKLPGGL